MFAARGASHVAGPFGVSSSTFAQPSAGVNTDNICSCAEDASRVRVYLIALGVPTKRSYVSERLASPNQLWRLNAEGYLKVVDEAEPITAPTAFELIANLVASTDKSEFDD